MMWCSNYGGDMYGFQTYSKTPLMLSMLGGIVGDEAVQAAIKKYAEAWLFKHPSPWDFIFFLTNEFEAELGWFWYYWLWTTESVDACIEKVERDGDFLRVVIRRDGRMPAPVVLRLHFADESSKIYGMTNAQTPNDGYYQTVWTADVWFDGRRRFEALIPVAGAGVSKITLDPERRFPDRKIDDNRWPRDD